MSTVARNQNPHREHRSLTRAPRPPPRRRRRRREERNKRDENSRIRFWTPHTHLDIRRFTTLRVRTARERLRAIAKTGKRSFVSQSAARFFRSFATESRTHAVDYHSSHAPSHRSPRVSPRASPGFEASSRGSPVPSRSGARSSRVRTRSTARRPIGTR